MNLKRQSVWFTVLLVLLVCTLASTPGRAHPGAGIVVDANGQVYFVHGLRNRIMKLDPAGKLTTFVEGEPGRKLSLPHHLVLDNRGNVYSVGDRDGQVWKINPDGRTTLVYPLPDLWQGIQFVGEGGNPFTLDAEGNIYCLNYQQEKYTQILKIGPDGRLSSLAGGDWGCADGKGSQARFGYLHYAAFAWTPAGALLVTDSGSSVRKIMPDGAVTTLAGGSEAGFADGPRQKARFKEAVGLAVDAEGNVYVADGGNRRVRKIAPNSRVSTLAGTGQPGHKDGPARNATFDTPVGIAVGRDISVYVLDYEGEHPRVRKISPGGNVTTIAAVE